MKGSPVWLAHYQLTSIEKAFGSNDGCRKTCKKIRVSLCGFYGKQSFEIRQHVMKEMKPLEDFQPASGVEFPHDKPSPPLQW